MGIEEHKKAVLEYQENIKERADAYERTIATIICFDSAVRWDDPQKAYLPNSFFLPCRRLSKTKTDGNVTPDIVVQLSPVCGIVGEVKITASTDNDFKNAYEQMQKYDQSLIGWKTPTDMIETHDLALLVDDFKRTLVGSFFQDKTFERNFSLIACAIEQQAKQVCKIEKYYGKFTDERIESKLQQPIPVALEKLIGRISSVKFYDTPPPCEYTMNVLWMNLFNEIKERGKEEASKTITVSCRELTEMLRERFSFRQEDDRQPKAPKKSWIKQALDGFVTIGYAEKDKEDSDNYCIKYSYHKKDDMLAVFSKKVFEASSKPEKTIAKGKQEELF